MTLLCLFGEGGVGVYYCAVDIFAIVTIVILIISFTYISSFETQLTKAALIA